MRVLEISKTGLADSCVHLAATCCQVTLSSTTKNGGPELALAWHCSALFSRSLDDQHPSPLTTCERLGFVRLIIEKVDITPYGEDAVITYLLTEAGREWLVEAGVIPPYWLPSELGRILRGMWEKCRTRPPRVRMRMRQHLHPRDAAIRSSRWQGDAPSIGSGPHQRRRQL